MCAYIYTVHTRTNDMHVNGAARVCVEDGGRRWDRVERDDDDVTCHRAATHRTFGHAWDGQHPAWLMDTSGCLGWFVEVRVVQSPDC